MTPERWKRLEEIFHAARGRDAADRPGYLAEACGGDESLRLQVESLLAHGDLLSGLESRVRVTSAPTAVVPATMVGPYRIEQRLDAGGMGVVYRALDTRLGRQVAIKIGLAQFSDRFHREARTIARLNHVNVCILHDIGSTTEIPGYLVMEFVEGPTLASRLANGLLSITESVQTARQIAAALAVAHEHGIVHRDLKPANVKITPQGVVKVLDFGLAKDFPGRVPVEVGEAPTAAAAIGDGTVTAAGTVLGTAAYMSPEQAIGSDTDARSDIFSFGIVLYEMLCGRRPFTGATPSDVMVSILKAEPAPPRRVRAAIPEPLELIVLKCLQRNPDGRYASGTELLRDLDKLLNVRRSGRVIPLRATLGVTAGLLAIAVGYVGWHSYRRHADLRWLEDTAVPQIATLLQQDRALEALHLYRRAEAIAPDSKLLYKLAEGVASHPVKFVSAPAGAKIYVSDYAAGLSNDVSQWQFVGTAPVTLSEVPDWGYYRVRAVKDGFASTDRVFGIGTTVEVTLHEDRAVPQDMVWVPAGPSGDLVPPSISLPGFWIDRFEVTNRQFREFVNAGGYRKKDYWKEPFSKDGRSLTWEQAMAEFHDLTGRPGPANWSLGTYPEGGADLPVAGVSWYEAMAYAAFAGKSIPTAYEWRRAAPIEFNADIVLMSNFSGRALAPVGKHHGMTTFGAYDMAGNVKEWTANASGALRYALGGAWDESSYTFSMNDGVDPLWRTVSMGFRTVRRVTPPPATSFAPLTLGSPTLVRTQKPVDDQTYRVLADLHRYQASALDARVERRDTSPPFWVRETVSFKAAYANDRVLAHVFLPKNVPPPYQGIVVFGGAGIMAAKRVEDFGFPYEFLIRSGRAVIIPAYWGTLERGPSDLLLPANEEIDRAIKWSRDLGRSIDYLQTRPDIDATKLGFYAISWGAGHTPRLLAVENRIRAAALLSGGLFPSQPREVDSWNFAPRYRVPTLMVNGRQDFTFPYETNQKVLFSALGTPAADKKLITYEGGHRNPVTRPDLLGEIISWFDRYLGPTQQEP